LNQFKYFKDEKYITELFPVRCKNEFTPGSPENVGLFSATDFISFNYLCSETALYQHVVFFVLSAVVAE
jgi:hypothetical protein